MNNLYRVFIAIIVSGAFSPYIYAYEVAVGHIYANRFKVDDNTYAYIPEILVEVYQNIGINIELVFLPDERAVKMTNKGRYQALDLRFDGIPDADSLIKVEPELLTVSVVAISNKNIAVKNIASLSDLSVVAQLGMQYTKKMPFSDKILYVTSPQEAAEMVFKGRGDVWLTSLPVFYLVKQQYPTLNLVSDSLLNEKLYHYIHHTQSYLLPMLSKSIETIHIMEK